MARSLLVIFLLALVGCSGLPAAPVYPSACAAGEATYECQIERYNDVNVP
jgi:hypothetical protein